MQERGDVEALSAILEAPDILESTIRKINSKKSSGTPAIPSPFTYSSEYRRPSTLGPQAAEELAVNRKLMSPYRQRSICDEAAFLVSVWIEEYAKSSSEHNLSSM